MEMKTSNIKCSPQLYLMKYGYMEVPSPETRSAQILSPDGLLDYILEFQVRALLIKPHLWWSEPQIRMKNGQVSSRRRIFSTSPHIVPGICWTSQDWCP